MAVGNVSNYLHEFQFFFSLLNGIVFLLSSSLVVVAVAAIVVCYLCIILLVYYTYKTYILQYDTLKFTFDLIGKRVECQYFKMEFLYCQNQIVF